MKFISEIFKLTQNSVRGRIYSEFVIFFAKSQHLFHIAANPIDVDWNFLSYPVPLFLSKFCQKCNNLICSWYRILPANFIEIRSCEAKEIYLG